MELTTESQDKQQNEFLINKNCNLFDWILKHYDNDSADNHELKNININD